MYSSNVFLFQLTSQAKRALAIISTSVLKKEDFENKDFNDTCAVCIENCKYARPIVTFENTCLYFLASCEG